ncbi:MAG: RluA family pseudouridine synthase [Lachnospiraceae bacterium]|nr:RluA family pseudouridine synthase [Lachnospiraceae bacterium]
MRKIRYDITTEYEGMKISRFLQLKGYSEKNLTVLRGRDETIYLNGRPVHMNETICQGDAIEVYIPEEEEATAVVPVNIPIDVVYEDEDIIVINKPANMPIHPSRMHQDNSLANALAYYYNKDLDDKDAVDNKFVFRCINRLDRDTTGLTIVAKHMVSAAILYNEMKRRDIRRTYYAIVEETPDNRLTDSGTIDAPIGRVDGIEDVKMAEDGRGLNSGTRGITRGVDFEKGQPAVTHYEVIDRVGDLALVQLKLETGRTHQIRVHMSYIGHPLIGDNIYNPRNSIMDRQALHAGELEFMHPITGEKLIIKADIPEDMRRVLNNN